MVPPHSIYESAWFSLDESDNDHTHFLTYIVAALQLIAANIPGKLLGCVCKSQGHVILRSGATRISTFCPKSIHLCENETLRYRSGDSNLICLQTLTYYQRKRLFHGELFNNHRYQEYLDNLTSQMFILEELIMYSTNERWCVSLILRL